MRVQPSLWSQAQEAYLAELHVARRVTAQWGAAPTRGACSCTLVILMIRPPRPWPRARAFGQSMTVFAR